MSGWVGTDGEVEIEGWGGGFNEVTSNGESRSQVVNDSL